MRKKRLHVRNVKTYSKQKFKIDEDGDREMDFELLAFDNYTTKFVVAGNYDGIKKKYTETNHTIEWATDDGLPPPGLRLDQQDYTESGNPD